MSKKALITLIAVVSVLVIAITGTVVGLVLGFAGNNSGGGKSEGSSMTDSSDKNDVSTDSKSEGVSSQSGVVESSSSIPEVTTGITTMSVGKVTAKKGDTVKVPVKVSSNKGFMGCFFKFNYDTANLKYVGYSKTPLLSDYQVQESNGNIKFMTIEKGNVTQNGTLIYLEFEVIGNSGTEAFVNLSIDKTAIANKQEQYVPVVTKNGAVTIE